MAQTTWLQTYYGDDFATLKPTILMEGKRYAVVRVVNTSLAKGFSRAAYVLIKKKGRHGVSDEHSMHEGVPTDKDMTRIRNNFMSMENL